MLTNGSGRARETPWVVHIRAADDALARKDVKTAVAAWDEAHLAAGGSWRWEGLIEVGDAYLRIGEATGYRAAAEATARRVYFAALYRACRKDSFHGVLRAAEAFADLGDQQAVEECLGVADIMAADDDARVRVQALVARQARLAGHTLPAEEPSLAVSTHPIRSEEDTDGPGDPVGWCD